MQVKKQIVASWQEAIILTQQRLKEDYGNIRIITSRSKLAKRYGVHDEQVQVRYW